MMTLFFMTGPSPVVSPKTKHGRVKEPYSDDESDKLNNTGGKGCRFYIDMFGDRVLVGDRSQTVNRKVKFDEDRYISSPEGQRSLSDQGSRVFLRDGLLDKQTGSRKEEEVYKITSDLSKVVRETLDTLYHRDVVDHRSLRVTLEERNNVLWSTRRLVPLCVIKKHTYGCHHYYTSTV